MEQLIIKEFGPIKEANITVCRINLFIGQISSGKSTVAKLLAIFNSTNFYCLQAATELSAFENLLADYNIDFKIKENTSIQYKKDDLYWKIEKKGLSTNFENGEIISKLTSFSFIPDEINLDELVKKYPFLLNQLDEEVKLLLSGKKLKDEFKRAAYIFRNNISRIVENLYKGADPVYIPAERNLFSLMQKNIYTLLNVKMDIPKSLIRFGVLYGNAQQTYRELEIPFCRICVCFDSLTNSNSNLKEVDKIILADKEEVLLNKASSGLQSLIPLFAVVKQIYIPSKGEQLLVIEEPESNLYPSIQKKLTEYIVSGYRERKTKIVMTSHSPYILSTIDTLVQASNAGKIGDMQSAKVCELVPEEKWIDYDDLSVYYFGDDGVVVASKDDDLKVVGGSIMDQVSEELQYDYNQLLAIRYAENEQM